MSSFFLLEQAEEDKLHSARLLTVEEKPFKRITKRLLASTSPIQSFYTRLPTPPADAFPEDEADANTEQDAFQKDLDRFRTDVTLDFAAFDASISRIQFLHLANEKERERYANEKLKIEFTAEDVRNNTSQLRTRLDEAQKTLAIRKTYDVLAEKITKENSLRTRDEQRVNIEKLKGEIEDLEREGRECEKAWTDRREYFERVFGEVMILRRLMRDEKDEAEGEKTEDGEDEHLLGTGRDRDGEPLSQIGSPRPLEDALTPAPIVDGGDSGVLTPQSTVKDHGEPPAVEDVIMGDSAEGDTLDEPQTVKINLHAEKVTEMDTT